MADVKSTTLQGEGPSRAELEQAIHALHGVFEVLYWINEERIGVAEDRLETRAEIVLAGQIITEALQRRF